MLGIAFDFFLKNFFNSFFKYLFILFLIMNTIDSGNIHIYFLHEGAFVMSVSSWYMTLTEYMLVSIISYRMQICLNFV